MQQFGFLRMQLYKGRFLHPVWDQRQDSSNVKDQGVHAPIQDDIGEYWEDRGLIRSSFVKGLTAKEFYLHTVSSREVLIRQALEVQEPGCLFKDLMLFMRDLYVAYDGTVRNNNGKLLIQFQYGGKAECEQHGTKNLVNGKDSENSRNYFIQAGDPVGILAATAIVQPTYRMLLDSSQKFFSTGSMPLKLLQETLYSRKKSHVTNSDQRVVLHLSESYHTEGHAKEQTALQIQSLLKNITLEMLSSSTWIEYEPDKVTGDLQGRSLTIMEPWIGHIALNKLMMDANNITSKEIFRKLSTINNKDILELGHILLSLSDECNSNCSLNGSCIHFCVSFPQGFTSVGASHFDTLSTMRDDILPFLLERSIIGHDCIESVAVSWEEKQSERYMAARELSFPSKAKGDLVVEVVVKKEHVKEKNDAWTLLLRLLGPVLDSIDWLHSMPTSIQGVLETFGIEASHRCILQRLKHILMIFEKLIHPEHMILAADLMTHTGHVIGFKAAGFTEFVSNLNISAPFTEGLFQKPVLNLQKAAKKGDSDFLSGVVASSFWGKTTPVGTGSNFDLLWRELQNY